MQNQNQELNKNELNDNLLMNITFLSKFIAGKNILENPNFNLFIPSKNLNNKISNKIKNEIIDNENKDLDFTNIENITENIDDNIDLKSRQSISFFNENIKVDINRSNTVFNLDESSNFDAQKQGNLNENSTFNLDETYNPGDVSSIYNFTEQRNTSVCDTEFSFLFDQKYSNNKEGKINSNDKNPNKYTQSHHRLKFFFLILFYKK